MNKYKNHLYVVPEDDANRQVADGFVLHDQIESTRIQVMAPAGGWPNVLKTFQDEYVSTLRNWPGAHVVLLVDFDEKTEDRRRLFEQAIPADLKARVFVVGSKRDPEALKKALNISLEQIGTSLAGDCHAGTNAFWGHEQLQHNDEERKRLDQTLKPFLF